MLLLEFFTQSHIYNITACLRLRPERLVFVGHGDTMGDALGSYRDILRKRGLRTEVSSCDISGKDLGDICVILRKYLQTQEECVIDLTGGDELVIMAVGAALAGLDREQQKRVQVQKFTLPDQTVCDCIHDNGVIPGKTVSLCVEEMIALHGGSICAWAVELPRDFSARDLDKLWQIVADDPKEWNKSIMVLSEFESRADSKNQVYLPLRQIRGSIRAFEEKEPMVRALLKKFHDSGVIRLRSSDRAFEYTYTDPTLRYCTLKAGNALEVKTLLEARSMLDNGAPYFQDCRMSVSIDWDGEDRSGRGPDTRNEIDVMVMRGVMPLFISCKNGLIGEEELYKLHTVAERFGGRFARKMLVVTELDQKNPASDRAFIQRAADMGITLVPNAAELTREQWREAFQKAIG